MPDTFGDPRFPRARCALCEFLCIMSQIAEYILVRVADGERKPVMLCHKCASELPSTFRVEKLLEG